MSKTADGHVDSTQNLVKGTWNEPGGGEGSLLIDDKETKKTAEQIGNASRRRNIETYVRGRRLEQNSVSLSVIVLIGTG